MTPKISIVIPSFNKVKFISKTLDSIFNQGYPNLEVIIQDGGSTDGSLKIIKSYISKYPKVIKFESKRDGGQLNAVNIGLSKSTGDILTFINADDVYTRNTFKDVIDIYIKNPHALWFAGRGIVIDENDMEIVKLVTWYKNFLLFFNSYFLLLTSNYLMQPSIFFTKEAYKEYGPFTGTSSFIMEYELWLRLGRIKMPVVIYKDFTKFRIEATTKTKTLFMELLIEDWKIVKKFTKNPLTLFLHKLNNLGRIFIGRFV